jgi:uncharacterized protein YwqG
MLKNLSELQEQIHTQKLERLETEIVRSAKPAVFITRSLIDNLDMLPLGASRLGGSPDLPAGYQWKYRGEEPLTFIAQFRLSQIAPYDLEGILPTSGFLYFFYAAASPTWGNYDERDGWEVLYIQDEEMPFVRTSQPAYKFNALSANEITFAVGMSLPEYTFNRDREHYGFRFESDSELYAYFGLLDSLYSSPKHRLVGYPQPIQTAVEEDCALFSLSPDARKNLDETYTGKQRLQAISHKAKEWQFLFQIDSDPNWDVCWGDVGMLYVCIPKTSLAACRFDDCWITLQC